ncbi:MAG TPA: PSP1 C-terminal domain-containing protein [Gemmataceae bacterium]|nr:PSP1 C-terminal domain-containing protein [Gemmataceae bacterium]
MTSGCEYLVSHGNSGGVGRFATAAALPCRRGDRVVVRSQRGLEMGVVLCQATPRHARLLNTAPVGELVRRAGPQDEETVARLRAAAHRLFEDSRRLAADLGLPIEILDVELLLDGKQAVVQHLQWADCDPGPLVEALVQREGFVVSLENLALPQEPAEEAHGGCGEPGCGRADGGGCSSCGSGGCSSCGSGKVEMTAYFAHLRAQMEEKGRVPLL